MYITSTVRWHGGSLEDMTQAARKAKAAFEKNGAEFFRVSRIHSGQHAGDWLVVTRYADWTTYGRCMDALSKDDEYQKLFARVTSIAQLGDRTLMVGVDL